MTRIYLNPPVINIWSKIRERQIRKDQFRSNKKYKYKLTNVLLNFLIKNK